MSYMSGARLKNSRAGPGESKARIIRLVSMTSRTQPIPAPRAPHRIDLRLYLLVAQLGPRADRSIGFRQRPIKPLREQAVQQRPTLVRRQLMNQIDDLLRGNRNVQAGHDSSLAHASSTSKPSCAARDFHRDTG